MKKCLIVAVSQNGVIGKDNTLPWRLLADMANFKKITVREDGSPQHAAIMGKNTWESLPRKFRPLPDRVNIVVSKTLDPASPEVGGAMVVRSLPDAYRAAERSGCMRAFVIGGASLYKEALPSSDVLYLTLVKADVEGDTHLHDFLRLGIEWRLSQREVRQQDERHQYPFEFRTYLHLTE